MGCGGSRSSRTLPAVHFPSSAQIIGDDDNDDDDDDDDDDKKNYAHVYHTCCHCGQRLPLPSPLSSHAPPSNSNSFFSNSIPSSGSYFNSETSRTSRSYSLLSTPSFHSPSRNARNNLVLDPSRTSRSYSPLSTPCFQSPSRNARNNLVLDPTLFPDAVSPSTACGVRGTSGTNIDTACGSRFSGTSLSSSRSLSAPSSPFSDERYPLPPLSVQTEPFPRLDEH
ncbi:unnamed protein product [Ectocarpus sp. 12 AP-2014]